MVIFKLIFLMVCSDHLFFTQYFPFIVCYTDTLRAKPLSDLAAGSPLVVFTELHSHYLPVLFQLV